MQFYVSVSYSFVPNFFFGGWGGGGISRFEGVEGAYQGFLKWGVNFRSFSYNN